MNSKNKTHGMCASRAVQYICNMLIAFVLCFMGTSVDVCAAEDPTYKDVDNKTLWKVGESTTGGCKLTSRGAGPDGHAQWSATLTSGALAGQSVTLHCTLHGARAIAASAESPAVGTYTATVTSVTLEGGKYYVQWDIVSLPESYGTDPDGDAYKTGSRDANGNYVNKSGWQSMAGVYGASVNAKGRFELFKESPILQLVYSDNPNYSLEGAEYTLTNTKDSSISYKLVTDENGHAVKEDIVPGTYMLKETKASKGFRIGRVPIKEVKVEDESGNEIYDMSFTGEDSLNFDDIMDDAIVGKNKSAITIEINPGESRMVTWYELPEMGGLKIEKTPDKSAVTDGHSAYSLKGAKYQITYLDDENLSLTEDYMHFLDGGVYETDENGVIQIDNLPVGKYLVKEIEAPDNMGIPTGMDTDGVEITITNGVTKKITKSAIEPVFKDPVKILLRKRDNDTGKSIAQGNASLAGAEFTVQWYDNIEGKTDGTAEIIIVYVTDDNGYIDAGDSKYMKSFQSLNGHTFEEYVDDDGNFWFPVGTLKITETKAPTGYLKSGQVLFTDPENNTITPGAGNTIIQSDTITVNNSDMSVTYILKHDGRGGSSITVLDDFEIPYMNDEVIKGGVRIRKYDAETNTMNPQGDASIAGAEFSIINRSKNAVEVWGRLYQPGEVCLTVIANENGVAETENNILPYGTYEIKETKAPEGYKLDSNATFSFDIRENGVIVDGSFGVKNTPIRGGVQITKLDKELGKSEAIAGSKHDANTSGSTLSNVSFELKNVSKKAIIYKGDGKTYQPGEVITVLKTRWNETLKAYTAETSTDALPYGTYEIKEVATNGKYLMTDGTVYTVCIREDDKLYTVDKTGKALTYSNYVVRGDIQFNKIKNMTSERMNTLWTLTNNSTGERHVIVADYNGEYNSSVEVTPHSYQTNANDNLLETIDAGQTISMNDVVRETGTWFGMGEDGTMAKAIDIYSDDYIYSKSSSLVGSNGSVSTTTGSKGEGEYVGALPYGQYTLQEVRTDTNLGTELQSFTFYVYKQGATIDLGTIEDYFISISTEALDDSTGMHIGFADGDVTLIDTITYEGAKSGETYTMVGYLMDASTGEMLTMTNEDGEVVPVTSTKEFVSAGKGKVDMSFTVDSSIVKGRTVVVFEELYGSNGAKLCEEKNLANEDQTVYYPGVKTEATVDGKHEASSAGEITIKDVVSYTNLIPGKEYTMTGYLMNKETKDNILDEKGKEIISKTTFKPEEPNGETIVEFTIDGSLLKGKTVVVFEEVSYRNVTVAVHADINDEKQTVQFLDIGTTATYGNTSINEGKPLEKTIIKDTVSYCNLNVGETYVLTGQLMCKDTGLAYVDATGKEVVATTEFKPESKDGTVVVTFEFDATNLDGQDVVVFETLKQNDMVIATHMDINDEGQTVHFPKVGTTLTNQKTGLHESITSDKTVLVDTVAYHDLQVGKTYTMSGTLYDKATNEVLKNADGTVITAGAEFTPEKSDGTVDITFTFDTTALKGKTVVAFESCSRDGVEVAVHADINDEDQTVHFPNISTVASSLSGTISGNGTDKMIYVSDSVDLVDTVTYDNLVVGNSYTIVGKLMLKSTGKELTKDDGTPYTANYVFSASDTKGFVSLQYDDVDITKVAGDSIVMFTDLLANAEYGEDSVSNNSLGYISTAATTVLLFEHHDINNTDETLTVINPEIHTTALSKESGTHMMIYNNKATLVDSVTYKDLCPGMTYTLKGVVMDKSTGEPITVSANSVSGNSVSGNSVDSDRVTVEAETTFTPESKDGSVDVVFTFDTTELAGKTLVVFEKLYVGETEIASHEDINDGAQSVYMMSLKTLATAKDGRSKTVGIAKDTVIKDIVTYTNLIPGQTYYLKGYVVDKTGKAVCSEQSVQFKPTESNGTTDITFTVDTSNMKGEKLVCFETVTDVKGNVLGEHKDLNDENQTVVVKVVTKVQTGIQTYAGTAAAVAVSVLVVGIVGVYGVMTYRKRKLNQIKRDNF